VRVALLSPYSWTYPGGVTRHIEALAAELLGGGHDVRVLAPFDPDDELSRRMHRGARPQSRQPDEHLVPLGRTVGLPANGAVSNLSLSAPALFRMREELRTGRYDVVHIHEPVVPCLGWDALCSLGQLPLVGTFHTYSENLLTNGIAALPLGGRRRMNRLHVRIAVSEAAAWTAQRFYGGRYRIIPNGVRLQDEPVPVAVHDADRSRPLRILFVGQAVERKGLPVLLRAFEALREQVDATLTLVGAGAEEVAHMMLDARGVQALGKVSEERKLAELARADVLCAPSLGGESFGMVLTEGFAAATPVIASDIPGYRDVMREGADGLLVPPGDALALAQALRVLALDAPLRARMAESAREGAERFAWPAVAAEVLDCYEQALAVGRPVGAFGRAAVRYGLAPADLQPRTPPDLGAPTRPARPRPAATTRRRGARAARRVTLLASSSAAAVLGWLALAHVGVTRVAASLLTSKPGLVAAALALMCAAMFARAIAWHAILRAAPTWRRAKRRDAMQGTFIGVLMSATQPGRLGEPSRALIVARRLGRARETLPLVLSTIVSQTILNVFALALLAGATLAGLDREPLGRHHDVLIAVALAPLAALLIALLAPLLLPPAALSRPARMKRLAGALRRPLARVREGLRLLSQPRVGVRASFAQLCAWALQLTSCWVLLTAFGLQSHGGFAAAAAVLFAVNITGVVPATPGNVGVFQAACAVVLVGAYHVSSADAIAFGIVLQAIEFATALLMGLTALVNEGLSWREVRLRAMHATPVQLAPLPGATRGLVRSGGRA
jgi:phosphatidylinositol alpha-mannosyltransferase